MTDEEFKDLTPGDIVRGKAWGVEYVVAQVNDDQVIAVRKVAVSIDHPLEWEIVRKGRSRDENAVQKPETG